MKNAVGTFLVMVALSSGVVSHAQNDISADMQAIKDIVTEVQVDKKTYKQQWEVVDASKSKVRLVNTVVDEKGATVNERYEFYLCDLDKNTLARKAVGKNMVVTASVNNNQRFIQYFKSDQLDSYVSSISIQTVNADKAQLLVDVLKGAIPLSKSLQKVYATPKEAMEWLKTNVSETSTRGGTVSQRFTYGFKKEYIASLITKSTDSKGVTTETAYEFNVMDINKNELMLKISGEKLLVAVETKGGEKLVKVTVNNQQQAYDNDFEVLSSDVEQARNIIGALTAAIDKSKAQMPAFTSLQQSAGFVAKNTMDVTIDQKTWKQTLAIEVAAGLGSRCSLSCVRTDNGKTTDEKMVFYLADMEVNSLAFKTIGKRVLVTFGTNNRELLVKTFVNNEIQNYQNDVSIELPGVEEAREMLEALKHAVGNSQVKSTTWASLKEAQAFLSQSVGGETLGGDTYKQSYEGAMVEPYYSVLKRNRTDAKGVATDESFEFYPYMLEETSVKITSKGKYLLVTANITNKQPRVKCFKQGTLDGFEGSISIMAFDAKVAKDIREALKTIIRKGEPQPKNWDDKKKAMDYVVNSTKDLKLPGGEMKQRLDLQNGDPCKLQVTRSTTDSKAVTTEEVFELSLSDISKPIIEMHVRGQKIEVVLTCKNNQKFIKTYKNSALQAYSPRVELYVEDVEVAKNMVDALKSATGKCE